MTPKEKAEEIFDRINICIPIDANFKDTGKEAFEKMKRDHLSTKKISLITVNEALEWTDNLVIIKFLNEVKEEIEKL